MSDAVMSFYTHLAGASDPVPSSVSDGIFRYASAQKNDALLTTLARRPDISPETLSALGKLKSAKIRAAYLSRPDRPEEELLQAVRSEKRVTVLSAMAGSTEASAALLEALSKLDHRTVAAALVKNTSCPDTARQTAVLTLTHEDASPSYELQYQLRALLDQDGDLQNAVVLRRGTSVWALQTVAFSRNLSEKARDILVDGWIIAPLRALSTGANLNNWEVKNQWRQGVNNALNVIGKEYYTVEQALRLAEFLQAEIDLDEPYQKQLESAMALRGLGDAGLTQDLTLARTASDPRELQRLAKETLAAYTAATQASSPGSWTRHRPTPEIATKATALIKNPHLPSEVAVSLLAAVADVGTQVLLARPEDPIYTATALAMATYHIRDQEIAAYLSTHRETLLALLEILGGYENSATSAYVIGSICSMGLIDEEMVRDLPWSVLTDPSASFAPSQRFRDQEEAPTTDITAVVTGLLASELGSDPALWEVFSVVGADFQGTVGDLLDLCRMTQSTS